MTAADIVIVGGGTAGCILAARLSESPDIRVTLLEAGIDILADKQPADIKDEFPRAFANPAYFWPGVGAVMRAGEAPRPFKQPRILGGGSCVMGMWALRGLPSDYDGWASAGATGWGWQDVLPYFQKLERDIDFPTPPHGGDGPIPVHRAEPRDWPGFISRIGAAAAERQLATADDLNSGAETDGVFAIPNSYGDAGRASSPSQYLTPAVRGRPNLEVRCGVHAASIALDGRRAVGVNVLRSDGSKEMIPARRVVVSAGGIHSPALLMRSGIGAAAELSPLGISPTLDQPHVGRNLQNHLYVHMGALIRSGYRQSATLRTFAIAGARVSSRVGGSPAGDIFLSFIARTMARDPGNQVGIVGAHLYAPRSRGTVRLASADPRHEPLIDFRYLEDETDRARLLLGARLGCDLLDAPAVKAATLERFMLPSNPPLGILNEPGIASGLANLGVRALPLLPAPIRRRVITAGIGRGRFLDALGRGEAFEQLVLDSYTAMFHPVGTCAIGTVVDPQTRVLGIEGLNVVDASIMPVIPRGNTNVPTSMVAERAAALLAAQVR